MRKQISRSVSGIIIVSSVVFSQPASAFFEAPTPQPTAEDKAWLEENSHDGVFPDYTTRLVWQDNVDVVTHKRALTGDAQAGDTSGSGLSAREYCEHLELAGYDNWELPTKTQMEHLYRVFIDQLVHEIGAFTGVPPDLHRHQICPGWFQLRTPGWEIICIKRA
ncbi:hypothetical protein [Salinivibrio sp. HTSP]|uniref:hypothetical protein n=1 Tax=Salinivibrio sp. HTSP TaxID=2115977 RepID=UPI000E30C8FE|nr:hypothetical protein [Salinivibrio sp. HTSP]